MKKPKLHTKKYYDFAECASYIYKKYELNSKDFWGYLVSHHLLVGGDSDYWFFIHSEMIGEPKTKEEEQAKKFLDILIKEFGDIEDFRHCW